MIIVSSIERTSVAGDHAPAILRGEFGGGSTRRSRLSQFVSSYRTNKRSNVTNLSMFSAVDHLVMLSKKSFFEASLALQFASPFHPNSDSVTICLFLRILHLTEKSNIFDLHKRQFMGRIYKLFVSMWLIFRRLDRTMVWV